MKKGTKITILLIPIMIVFGLLIALLLDGRDKSALVERIQNLFPREGGEEETFGEKEGGLSDEEIVEGRLFSISKTPVTGFIYLPENETLRYMERGTGHIFEYKIKDKNIKRVSNNTIPKIKDVWWGNGGNVFIISIVDQGAEIFELVTLSFPKTSTSTDIESGMRVTREVLPHVSSVSLSPDGKELFYIVKKGAGSDGVIKSLSSKKTRVVWTTLSSEWVSVWNEKNTIILFPKPSGYFTGSVYQLNPQTKSFKKIFGEGRGITALPDPLNKKILFSFVDESPLKLGVYDVEKKSTMILASSILSEKCVWDAQGVFLYCGSEDPLPEGMYPDDWYKGVVSFSDDVLAINTETGESRVLVKGGGEDILHTPDITKPVLSSDSLFLYFIDKKDAILHALSIQ